MLGMKDRHNCCKLLVKQLFCWFSLNFRTNSILYVTELYVFCLCKYVNLHDVRDTELKFSGLKTFLCPLSAGCIHGFRSGLFTGGEGGWDVERWKKKKRGRRAG